MSEHREIGVDDGYRCTPADAGFEVRDGGGETVFVELLYPKTRRTKFVEVGLECVRAADSIRISYDYDRDGWKVEQASTFEWPVDDGAFDEDWQEVAFVPAWARLMPPEDAAPATLPDPSGGEG